MKSHRHNRKSTRYILCTAMAAALVTGGVSYGEYAFTGIANASQSKSDRTLSKAIDKAEQQVASAPQNMAARAELANAYLSGGRFEAAVTTYRDAQQLGDVSVRTALSLALAHTGAGQNAEAIAILDEWRDSIPAADLGLALALAGDTGRGVSILSDALRGGEDTVSVRQNLAYAYALDGRWREARVMVAQDVPADELDARISEWARQGRPEDYRVRVAGLLGAPVASDEGQPQRLALSGRQQPALAIAEQGAPANELPPVENGESFWVADTARQEDTASPQDTNATLASAEDASGFNNAFAASEPESGEVKFVSKPVVQPLPASYAAAPAPAPARSKPTVAAAPMTETAGGSFMVQLGSFSSQANADRAVSIYAARHPELSKSQMVVTEAIVRGKKYWRVAASGFGKTSARSMCSTVKGRGGGCFAYSSKQSLPGAQPGSAAGGTMRAR